MINAISPSVTRKATPSFGMAKLNDYGKEAASQLGVDKNTYLNTRLYENQGAFKKPAIIKSLESKSFATLCDMYGCTKNAQANADFINNQILNPKTEKAVDYSAPENQQALLGLYQANYDNPRLSTKSTKALLDKVRDTMAIQEYLQFSGLLSEGTQG